MSTRGVLGRAAVAGSLALAMLMAPDGAPLPVAPSIAAAASCPTGWDPDTELTLGVRDVLDLGDGTAVGVGARREDAGEPLMISVWWDGETWTPVSGPKIGDHASLAGVAGSLPGRLWAVGEAQRGGRGFGIAVRWVNGAWVAHSPPRPRSGGEVLSAVDVDPFGGVWAVGLRATPGPVRSALVWHRSPGGRWTAPKVPGGRGSALSAVRAFAPDDVWAAGTQLRNGIIQPLLLHWDGDDWSAMSPWLDTPEAVISGLAGGAPDDLWAVGYRRNGDVQRPLVLHWNGSAWSAVDPPALGGAFSMLFDVSLDAAGRPWVVGTIYRDALDQYVPAAARRDGGTWQVWPRPPGNGRWFTAVAGDPAAGGFAVGRATAGSVLSHACEADGGGPPAIRRATTRPRRTGSSAAPRFGPAGRPIEDLPDGWLPAPRTDLPAVLRLPEPRKPRRLVARNVAHQLGLSIVQWTHGASIADLDGDGRNDLFIGHHGRLPSLWYRTDAGFEQADPDQFARVDRHDCEFGRIDADDLPDLVCSIGADRGVGNKANELWLDPGTGASNEVGVSAGIADPVGRGRDVALLDVDGDGDLDLYSGNAPMRLDALPSPNRLYLNDGTGHFTWYPSSGLTADLGSWCALPRDFDRDGDTDLVVCGTAGDVVSSSRIVLYRNDGNGDFQDVTQRFGVTPIGEIDAEMAQLGGDRHPDLVQLSRKRLRISIWSKGRYRVVWERGIGNGRAVAVGDVNGDGARDLYLQRGTTKGNAPDVVLINDGTGRKWSPISVPSTAKGTPEDVIAMDVDGNGLTDFLVLNGWNGPGPVQLIAFTRPGETFTAGSRTRSGARAR